MVADVDFNAEVVGFRQSKKLLEENQVQKVIVANDADNHIINPIVELCKQQNVDIIYVNTKKELGKICKLEVPAAVAVELKK